RVRRIASRVLFEPVPGMVLMRPAACSTTAAMTRSCSSWSSVGDSPVVPTGARQSVPCSICHSTSRPRPSKSIAPLLKGVMRATVTPANCSPRVRILHLGFGMPGALLRTVGRLPGDGHYPNQGDGCKGENAGRVLAFPPIATREAACGYEKETRFPLFELTAPCAPAYSCWKDSTDLQPRNGASTLKNKRNREEPEVIGFLGVGLDNYDGHTRLTQSEHFLLVGGSEETHERMQDRAIRFTEALRRSGKTLQETPLDEVLELLDEAYS